MDANENCATPQQQQQQLSVMSAVTNDTAEVRKLQDLVRKLELQNAELRMSQAASKGHLERPSNGLLPVNHVLRTTDDASSVDDDDDDDDEPNKSGLLDDVDLIDVEQLELSDEDSWLFESPNSLTPEQKAVSPYKWMRSDVEDPANVELQIVKRALVSKIEGLIQASIVNSNQTPRPSKTYLTSWDDRSPEPSLRTPLCARLSSCGGNAQAIDTRTFTRPKKSLISLELPIVDSVCESASTRTIDRRPPTPPPSLTDVSDIHTIARLQEECLRQCSPPPTPRRNSGTSTSSQRSVKSQVTDHDAHEATLANNVADSRHCDRSPMALSGQSSAASISPPVSPHDSQYLEEIRAAESGVGKRSLPNLPRPHNGMSCSPRGSIGHTNTAKLSNSNCDIGSVNDQTPRLAAVQRYSMSPLRKVGGIPRSSSPATRLSSVPVRRSSHPIADDGSAALGGGAPASRIPKPRQTRSAIPMRATYGRTAVEESWKDGCY